MLQTIILTLIICATIITVVGYAGETTRKIFQMKYDSRPTSLIEALTGKKAGQDDE